MQFTTSTAPRWGPMPYSHRPKRQDAERNRALLTREGLLAGASDQRLLLSPRMPGARPRRWRHLPNRCRRCLNTQAPIAAWQHRWASCHKMTPLAVTPRPNVPPSCIGDAKRAGEVRSNVGLDELTALASALGLLLAQNPWVGDI